MRDAVVDGFRREKNKGTATGSLKFRILVVIPPFYRPVALRGPPGAIPRGARITNHAPRNRRRRSMRRLGDTIIGEVARCDVGEWDRRTMARRLLQRRVDKTTRIATDGSARRLFTTRGLYCGGPRMGEISRIGESTANSLRNAIPRRPKFPAVVADFQ